ncbi:MAG TPA: hypothetical protein VIO14_09440 [Dehalococcoidia bacterium]
MEDLATLSWRVYPALALVLLGAALAGRGFRLELSGFRLPVADPAKAVTIMRGFRWSVIGLALAGAGIAWIWGLAWLLAISLVVGAGETFETSLDVFALERLRRRQGPPGGDA